MNTNELAEQLDEYVGNNGYSHNDYADSMSQASTMLRQQQAEIKVLNETLQGRDRYIDLLMEAQEDVNSIFAWICIVLVLLA